MPPEASILFESIAIILPISFIALRILLDELETMRGVPSQAKAEAYMWHAVLMIGLLVIAGWLAVGSMLFDAVGANIVKLGYVFAGVAITVPAWLLWRLRAAFDAAEFADA